jgi:hypothetical protein
LAKKSRTPTPPRKVQAPQRRVESRRKARSPEDRRTLYWAIAFAASGIAAIAIVVLVFTVLSGGGSGSAAVDQSKLVGLQTGPAPWNAGVDHLTDRLAAAGLSQLGTEGEVVHIHQHLDIYVNGKHIKIPTGVGIYDGQYLTELHTHDSTGVLHVESPKKETFDLGQFFAVWGVRLDNNCIGGYCRPDTPWKIYVDGKEYTGDPGELALTKHEEIAIVIGTPPKTVPSRYSFPGGL